MATSVYTVLGLGNPGSEYIASRHNAGRMVLEKLRERVGLHEWVFSKKFNAQVAEGTLGRGKATQSIVLMLPETFMNKSGATAKAAIKSQKAAERLVVVYDDLDLPVGTIKLAFGRGAGGHKGLESVIRAVGTRDFTRVRVGISPSTPSGKLKKPQGDGEVVDHVLGPFKKSEKEKIDAALSRAAEAIETIVREGREKAMNVFNSSR